MAANRMRTERADSLTTIQSDLGRQQPPWPLISLSETHGAYWVVRKNSKRAALRNKKYRW
jgi:hypothetical protein